MAGRNEKKNITKSKIVNYIINNKITSKAELAQNLSLSMPTVLSNVNELIERNMVIEIGEYESTGGRKAKRIGINPAYKYAVGVVITANHLGIVLLNMQYEIEKTEIYFRQVNEITKDDIDSCCINGDNDKNN